MTESRILAAFRRFATEVTAKSSGIVSGEAEEQLRAPFETLMMKIGGYWGMDIVCKGETPLPNRLGKPDFAITKNELLCGYVELKAPGKGANSRRFSGHDREQFKRFSQLPNVLYCDGNEWANYKFGELEGKINKLPGDVQSEGADAVSSESARIIAEQLHLFLSYEPIIPTGVDGKVDFQEFARQLALLCKFLRDDVKEALGNAESDLRKLQEEWRELLFPKVSDEQFADAYAQTVIFALLMARIEGAGADSATGPLSFENARDALKAEHRLLYAALGALIDEEVYEDLYAVLLAILRLVGAVPGSAFQDDTDPWLYFYEDFLAKYDPNLRKDAGVYYTPVPVVRAQVRLVDELLKNQLNKQDGFANPDVITLDPAVGTGTYLLSVIEHSMSSVVDRYGIGALPGNASQMANNLYGFELMVGPYAVAEFRLTNALKSRGAHLPENGARIYLNDTLESPNLEPPQAGLLMRRELAKQQERALHVKKAVKVLVCIGNPPYDRAMAEDSAGGWVRHGEMGVDDLPILNDFTEPARVAGFGTDLKNLYNLYVFFWRWALWKVFEQEHTADQGIVSFITASSFIDGKAFVGMREHMRRVCEEIWIIDLGGDSRGARPSENVFNIQTPVAITIASKSSEKAPDTPARVHYSRIDGTRAEKLAALDAIENFEQVAWQACPNDWLAPFFPAGIGCYFDWPLLTDLMPWQHSGVQLKRTWPIGPDESTLQKRWRGLLQAGNRASAFREDRDQKIHRTFKDGLLGDHEKRPISELSEDTGISPVHRYAYRFLDRQHLIVDRRLISFPRPSLWRAHSENQLYLMGKLTRVLGEGPALIASSSIPDIHQMKGGGKDVIPLYRNADASEANIMPGLLAMLSEAYGRAVTPEEFAAYLYGILAQPAFTKKFYDELETREVRVPLTKDGTLFQRVSEIGARLLWLHTYGERYLPPGRQKGEVPGGEARCLVAVPMSEDEYPENYTYDDHSMTLWVGKGRFAPVAREIFEYEVSGLKVVQSWLGYRMKKGQGRKSSPLDDIRPVSWSNQFTRELLELLWVLEATVALYPEQAALLESVINSVSFTAEELPEVPKAMKKAPPAPPPKQPVLSRDLKRK